MTCKQCGVKESTLQEDGRCNLCHATDREFKVGDKVGFAEYTGYITAIRITQGNCVTYECGYFADGKYCNVELYNFEITNLNVSKSIGFGGNNA